MQPEILLICANRYSTHIICNYTMVNIHVQYDDGFIYSEINYNMQTFRCTSESTRNSRT